MPRDPYKTGCAKVEAAGRQLPPSERGAFLAAVRASASGASTHADLASLRRRVHEPQKRSKTSTGTPVPRPSVAKKSSPIAAPPTRVPAGHERA